MHAQKASLHYLKENAFDVKFIEAEKREKLLYLIILSYSLVQHDFIEILMITLS